MTNKLTLLALFLLPISLMAGQSDLTQPVQIEADKATFYKQRGLAVFKGHVLATQGKSKTTGNQLILHLDKTDKKIGKMIVTGTPATYKTVLEKHNAHLNARADIIKYYPERTLITLEKHAKVTRAGDSISSNQINLNIKTETITAKGTHNTNGQTKIIINPKDMR